MLEIEVRNCTRIVLLGFREIFSASALQIEVVLEWDGSWFCRLSSLFTYNLLLSSHVIFGQSQSLQLFHWNCVKRSSWHSLCRGQTCYSRLRSSCWPVLELRARRSRSWCSNCVRFGSWGEGSNRGYDVSLARWTSWNNRDSWMNDIKHVILARLCNQIKSGSMPRS